MHIVGSFKGVFDAFRRFVSEFHTTLHDGDGEVPERGQREPQPEVLVTFIGQPFEDLFQGRHETFRQVTVLEEDPQPLFFALIDCSFDGFALALTHRFNDQFLAHVLTFRDVFDLVSRVRAGG